jgi:2'-5' RNA ligase
MAMLPESFREHVATLQKRILKRDLIELEDQPHVTVKYGLLTDSPSDVQSVLHDSSPIKFQLMQTECFPGLDKDVLYVSVWSDCLRKLNAKLVGALEFKDDHAVYNPHMTVAYLKPGMGKKYEGFQDLQGLEVILNEVVFSDSHKVYNKIMLNGDKTRTEAGMLLSFCPNGPGGGVSNDCSNKELQSKVDNALDNAVANDYKMEGYKHDAIARDLIEFDSDLEDEDEEGLIPYVKSWLARKVGKN